MNQDKQRYLLAQFHGWKQVSAVEAAINGTIVRDKRFKGFRRKILRWNESRTYGGWMKTLGVHWIDIEDGHTVTTEELLADYELPTMWKDAEGNYHKNPLDYLNDLNALHEIERMLTGTLWDTYIERLEDITGTRHLVWATAAQKCEALLRTLGLWEEEEK